MYGKNTSICLYICVHINIILNIMYKKEISKQICILGNAMNAIENNTWQNLYHNPYQPEISISVYVGKQCGETNYVI